MNTGEKKPPAKDIDEYLASCPPDIRDLLQTIRTVIRKAEPRSEESIQYRIPAFTYHGPLVFFAMFPRHLGLYVVDAAIFQKFAEELKPFKKSGTTIHFSVENPLPESLVFEIVRERARDNEKRYQEKAGESG